jgi:hypothetical protein
MGRSPGSMGHIQLDQLRAVDAWVDEAVAAGDIVVFAGHHNWLSLGLPSRILLRGLMAKLRHPLVYLSAHTHRGFWAEHRLLSRNPLLELNVSSLSDWPLAYRRISFAYDTAANRLRVRAEILPQAGRPIASYDDLLAAWEAQACGKSGVSVERLRREDHEIVREQRESRGSLISWLLSAIPACEGCDRILYDHAQAYQDAMLHALLQTHYDILGERSGLSAPSLPAWCGDKGFVACAGNLLGERSTDFRSHVDLFRRKATLVAAMNDHLDGLQAPQAKAYMTCRAVLAAKIDYDMTEESHRNLRDEDKRRAEQFFRIEASVGRE